MAERTYSDRQVAEAARLNRLVEDDWEDRRRRGLPPSGQAEAAYQREFTRRRDRGEP